jgi:hypothetical protein
MEILKQEVLGGFRKVRVVKASAQMIYRTIRRLKCKSIILN